MLQNNQNAEFIAAILGEEQDSIEKICNAAGVVEPKYNCDAIYDFLNMQNGC